VRIQSSIKNKAYFYSKYFLIIGLALYLASMSATMSLAQGLRKPIVIEEETEPLEERFKRTITLDVREMNIIDVIKFLSIKGSFNMVASDKIQGRVTLYLKNVSIVDALDLMMISNNLGYYVENNIIYVMPGVEYEAMFGKKFNDKLEVEIVRLKYARPQYITKALDNMKSTLGRILIDEDTGSVIIMDTPESLSRMRATIEKLEKPVEFITYQLQYAKADLVAEKLKARLEALGVGSFTVDERSNKIIIRGQPERRKEIEKMLKDLDEPTKEVLVEARILQIVLNPKYDYGIDWEKSFADSYDRQIQKLHFTNVYLDEDNLATSDNVASQYGKIAVGDISTDLFAASLRALRQVSDTKILSNPKLLVTNNQEAKIHVGDTVPYIISTTSGTGDNAITSEDVRFVDVGLKLNVTPSINDDGFVTMTLKPEISSVVSSVSSQGGGIPQVNKTEVETTVIVKDGQTIILGGLKKDNKVHTRKGFPFLMDLPFIGNMFSATADSIESTEIVIFITPHVISGKDDYHKIKGSVKPPKEYSDKDRNRLKKTTPFGIKE